MIGGPPIYAPRPFLGLPPGAVPQQMPAQQMMPQPLALQAQQVPPQRQPQPPVRPYDAGVTTTIRGVSGESRPPAPAPTPPRTLPPDPVSLPSPEQLGVAAPRPHDPTLDWEAIRKRLRDLGAVSFQLDTLPDGSCRFVCHLATVEFGQTQGIEARATTEKEAVQQALSRAELWKRRN